MSLSFYAKKTQASLAPSSLHNATREGDLNKVKLTIEAGSAIDQTDVFGSTPLHLAAMYGHTDIAEYLIAHGAQINPKTYDESHWFSRATNAFTPLDLAIKYAPNTQVISLLLEHGGQSHDWAELMPAILEDLDLAIFEKPNVAQRDLILNKFEMLANSKPTSFWFTDNDDPEDAPIIILLENLATFVEDANSYNRLIDTINILKSADTDHEAEQYVLAKNLLLAFPSDESYTFTINDHTSVVEAQGFFPIYTVGLAAQSLLEYEASINEQLDIEGFLKYIDLPSFQGANFFAHADENQKMMFADGVYSYSYLKQNTIHELATIYEDAANWTQKRGLYETSQQIYDQYNQGETILLASGWYGHTIALVLDKDTNVFAVANAGHRYPEFPNGFTAYNPQFAITADDIYNMLNNEYRMELEFKKFYDLGLEYNPSYSLKTLPQAFGNCTWYSQQVAEKGLMLLSLQKANVSEDNARKLTDLWFEELDDFHQTTILEKYLENPTLSPNALGDILINYHSDLDLPSEKYRALRIIDTLTSPETKPEFDFYYQLNQAEISDDLHSLFNWLDYHPDSSNLQMQDILDTMHDVALNTIFKSPQHLLPPIEHPMQEFLI